VNPPNARWDLAFEITGRFKTKKLTQ